jgi:hypothetical protein
MQVQREGGEERTACALACIYALGCVCGSGMSRGPMCVKALTICVRASFHAAA